MTEQPTLAGHDWRTEGDKRRQAAAEARRKKIALQCAARLDAAIDAISEHIMSCIECDDGTYDPTNTADGRDRLKDDMRDLAHFLRSKYG